VQYDQAGTIRFRPDPNTADTKNLLAAGLRIWNESHAVDPSLGGPDAPYNSPAWRYQFQQNGKANSIGVPLPFPNMIGWEAYFPAYKPDATKQEVAPGEAPFNQCDNYRKDGDLALADFRLKNPGLSMSDVVPGTVATRAQIEDNIKINYNAAAKAYGCTRIPYPEADGKTVVQADPPPVVTPRPKPNTLNGEPLPESPATTGGPYTADAGAGSPDVPPGPAPSNPTGGGPLTVAGPVTTVPAGVGAPGLDPRFGAGGDPTFGGSVVPAGSQPQGGRMFWVLAVAGVALYFATKEGS
jgi:hypothetical protein